MIVFVPTDGNLINANNLPIENQRHKIVAIKYGVKEVNCNSKYAYLNIPFNDKKNLVFEDELKDKYSNLLIYQKEIFEYVDECGEKDLLIIADDTIESLLIIVLMRKLSYRYRLHILCFPICKDESATIN